MLHHPKPFQKQIFAFNICRCCALHVEKPSKAIPVLGNRAGETFLSGGIGLILIRCCQGCSKYPRVSVFQRSRSRDRGRSWARSAGDLQLLCSPCRWASSLTWAHQTEMFQPTPRGPGGRERSEGTAVPLLQLESPAGLMAKAPCSLQGPAPAQIHSIISSSRV